MPSIRQSFWRQWAINGTVDAWCQSVKAGLMVGKQALPQRKSSPSRRLPSFP
ncbi:hypothetical protein [Neisseria sicca]|uniref:hypothetical protein n=1 Tax=Neisseria sicca TaxID=490 RepID=UPI001649F41F|nr:hypothetical protein [Neisseria sicca]